MSAHRRPGPFMHAPAYGDGVLPTQSYHRMRGPDAGLSPDAGLFGARQIKFGSVMQFCNTVMLALICLLILAAAFKLIASRREVADILKRMETVETLARNVNDASQVLRRVMGSPYPQTVSQHSLWGKDATRPSALHRWIEPRSPDEEAIITDTAAEEIVKGVRAVIGLISQVEKSRIIEHASQIIEDADGVMTQAETKELLAFLMKLTMHDGQVQEFGRQSVELLTHFEAVLLPLMDTLAAETRAWQHGPEGGAKSIEQEILDSQQMRARLRQFGAMAKEVGEGVHDLMRWYRQGGPADAVALGADMIATSKELIESPAAASLVRVLEGIDWRRTGGYVGDATRDLTAILGDIHESGAVMSGDRVMRSVALLLEKPGVQRLLDATPGIANNLTALLAQPNSQALITRSGALVQRVENMLGEAEDAKTVEKSAEFLGIMRELLGGLIHGGLHLELGDEPVRPRERAQRIGRVAVAPEA